MRPIMIHTPTQIRMRHRLEETIEKTILLSRWILVIFYLGLAFALLLYAYHFMSELFLASIKIFKGSLEPNAVLLKMLVFIDKSLVASLIVMVMLSGYENFISKIEVEGDNEQLSWLSKLNPGSLKIKVASSIVAISSIHLLQVFLDVRMYTEQWHVMWLTIIHMAFVTSALMLGYLERLLHHGDHDHASADDNNHHHPPGLEPSDTPTKS